MLTNANVLIRMSCRPGRANVDGRATRGCARCLPAHRLGQRSPGGNTPEKRATSSPSVHTWAKWPRHDRGREYVHGANIRLRDHRDRWTLVALAPQMMQKLVPMPCWLCDARRHTAKR